MVYTKLERSFDSDELHKLLATTLNKGHGTGTHVHKIERPPLPPGSRAFEQAKDELEVERQAKVNGPAPHQPPETATGNQHLSVPGGSHRPGSGRPRLTSGRRTTSLQRPVSPSPHTRHLGVPVPTYGQRPGSGHSSGRNSRSASPGPRHDVTPCVSRLDSYKPS